MRVRVGRRVGSVEGLWGGGGICGVWCCLVAQYARAVCGVWCLTSIDDSASSFSSLQYWDGYREYGCVDSFALYPHQSIDGWAMRTGAG